MNINAIKTRVIVVSVFVSILVLSPSCKKDEKKIQGDWCIDKITSDGVDYLADLTDDEDVISGYYEFSFDEDGDYRLTASAQYADGTNYTYSYAGEWEIDGDELVLFENDGSQTARLTIDKLTNRKLELSGLSSGDLLEIEASSGSCD